MKTLAIRTLNTPLLEQLTYEQRGKLMTFLVYSATDEMTPQRLQEVQDIYNEFCSDVELMKLFYPFKSDFDNDKRKYEETVARNRYNGRKGGRPKGSTNSPKATVEKTQKTSIDGLSMINLNHNIYKKEKERKISPTLEEVLSVAQQLMVVPEIAEKFYWYYDAVGWMINGRPITNWRSKLMEWKNNESKYNNNANANSNSTDFRTSRKQTIFNDVASAIIESENGDSDEFDFSIL